MSEKKLELIVKIDMYTRRGYNDKPYGVFEADVYGRRAHATYDDAPTEYIAGYESPWARFAMEALYGNPDLAEGRAYGFAYGYKADGALVKPHEAERFAKGLAKVTRAYDKLCATLRPMSLGQEVAYVLHALGVTTACWRLPDGQGGHGPCRGWRIESNMEAIRYHIDSTIEEFRMQQREAQAA